MKISLRTNQNKSNALEPILFQLLADRSNKTFEAISGYVGRETVEKLRRTLDHRPDLSVKLVVGMAAKEGISQKTYDSLGLLHNELVSNRGVSGDKASGVYWFFSGEKGERSRGIHAKAYRIRGDGQDHLFVGSSNFSSSGLTASGNYEMTVTDVSVQARKEFDEFFRVHLTSGLNFVEFSKVADFPIRGKSGALRQKLTGLQKVERPVGFRDSPFVDIDLAKNIEKKSKSSLNVCFGRGRWARSTGKVTPRTWYEVEIVCPKSVTSSSAYPKGNFTAITSDGFKFEGRTQGDYQKNLRSKEDLRTLGIWIKGLLEDAGALSRSPEETVTAETFEAYGNSILRLYRISQSQVVMHFPQDPSDL